MAIYKTLHRIRLSLLDCVRRTVVWEGLVILLTSLGLAFMGRTNSAAEESNQLRTLPAVEVPRFKVTDRDWPGRVGEASLCLWRDDKLAAVSFTIDDNAAPDHAWWTAAGEKYHCRFTWFVISGRVGSGGSFDGEWADFAKLREAGHDVQSHTVDHFNPQFGTVLPTEENYSRSIEQLESNVPGLRALTLAYPGGRLAKNDPHLAAKYFIAARGSSGPFNPANNIDYQNVRSVVRCASLSLESTVGLPNLINPSTKNKMTYRGWACLHFHGLENARIPDLKPSITATLDYFAANQESFWIGTFSEVAQYGQERDTATIRCVAEGAKSLKLTVTDRMDDRLFDIPLTIKLRMANGWSKVTMRQGECAIPTQRVEHDGVNFMLLNVVPDRGDVIITWD